MSRVSVNPQAAPGPLLSEWSRHLRQVQGEGGGEEYFIPFGSIQFADSEHQV